MTAVISARTEPRERQRVQGFLRQCPSITNIRDVDSLSSVKAVDGFLILWGLPQEVPWKELTNSSDPGRVIVANRLLARSALIRKDLLCHALKASRRTSNILPETHIVDGIEDLESILSARGGMWVIKSTSSPSSVAFVENTPEVMQKVAACFHSTVNSRWVVQRCITTPRLLQRRKFQIDSCCLYSFRAFVLLMGTMSAFVHEDMYLLAAADVYNEQDFSNRFAQLTNRSVQLQNERYRQAEQLLHISVLPDSQRMADAIRSVCRATFEELDQPQHRKSFFPLPNTFELFAFDLMADQAGALWLLDANACPATWLSGSVVEDTLQLVLDRLVHRAPAPEQAAAEQCATSASGGELLAGEGVQLPSHDQVSIDKDVAGPPQHMASCNGTCNDAAAGQALVAPPDAHNCAPVLDCGSVAELWPEADDDRLLGSCSAELCSDVGREDSWAVGLDSSRALQGRNGFHQVYQRAAAPRTDRLVNSDSRNTADQA